jgi:glutamyl-tRNA synthetase
MSKRQAGVKGIYISELRDEGYLPEALVNWIALMGWSYDDHTEYFSMQDLIEKFSLEKLNPSPAAVNYGKLDHFNGLHIRALPIAELSERIRPYFEAEGYEVDEDRLQAITAIIQERIRTLDEAVLMAGFFFRQDVEVKAEELVGKKMDAAQSAEAAQAALETIESIAAFKVEPLEEKLRALADSLGLKVGQLFGILRIAVTGQKVSPPLIESMVIIGKETVEVRIRQAVSLLKGME